MVSIPRGTHLYFFAISVQVSTSFVTSAFTGTDLHTSFLTLVQACTYPGSASADLLPWYPRNPYPGAHTSISLQSPFSNPVIFSPILTVSVAQVFSGTSLQALTLMVSCSFTHGGGWW